MILKITYVLIGVFLASIFFWFALYFSGLFFEKIGIELFHSEADQQRNFNIAFVVWIGFAMMGGWAGYRLQKKRA